MAPENPGIPAIGVPLAERHVTVDGCRMRTLVAGEGPPLVLVHGLGTSALSWERNMEALTRCGCVYAVDLPGFGASDAPPRVLSAEELADTLELWCATMDLPRATFLGHSLGGEVCMWLAAKYPHRVDRLILASPTGARSRFGLTRRFGRLVADGIKEPFSFLPTLFKAYYQAGPRRIYRTAMASDPERLASHLGEIRAPTLVLWGRHDPVVPLYEARQLARAIPGARLSILTDGAHGLIFDAHEDFNEAVCRFIEESVVSILRRH